MCVPLVRIKEAHQPNTTRNIFTLHDIKICVFLESLIITSVSSDIDECVTNIHDCDENAECFNIFGSYNCTCSNGFTGDGNTCTGMVNLVFAKYPLL